MIQVYSSACNENEQNHVSKFKLYLKIVMYVVPQIKA